MAKQLILVLQVHYFLFSMKQGVPLAQVPILLHGFKPSFLVFCIHFKFLLVQSCSLWSSRCLSWSTSSSFCSYAFRSDSSRCCCIFFLRWYYYFPSTIPPSLTFFISLTFPKLVCLFCAKQHLSCEYYKYFELRFTNPRSFHGSFVSINYPALPS